MPARGRMDYNAPSAYERLIAPRYAAIAEALVEAADVRAGEHVLELGAGTGLVTSMVAERVAPSGSLCATDLSRGMLELARERVDRADVSFVIADYSAQLPFLDDAFDVVVSGLTYVQNTGDALAEAARVLAPGGRSR
ncbi:MAG TPA: methyltransferase domain-containing protein [Gaiellaceae bacterium]